MIFTYTVLLLPPQSTYPISFLINLIVLHRTPSTMLNRSGKSRHFLLFLIFWGRFFHLLLKTTAFYVLDSGLNCSFGLCVCSVICCKPCPCAPLAQQALLLQEETACLEWCARLFVILLSHASKEAWSATLRIIQPASQSIQSTVSLHIWSNRRLLLITKNLCMYFRSIWYFLNLVVPTINQLFHTEATSDQV